MAVCWLESVPRTGLLKVIGSPINAPRLPAESGVPAEFCKKLAFKVVDWLTWIGLGLAVFVSTIHGSGVSEPPLPDPKTAVSQPAAPGPPLQPHQLSVAVPTVPALFPTYSPLAVAAVLPTMR